MPYNPAYNENISSVLATSAGLDQATSFMHTWMVPIIAIVTGIWILLNGDSSSSSSSSYSVKKGGRVVDKSDRSANDQPKLVEDREDEPEIVDDQNEEETVDDEELKDYAPIEKPEKIEKSKSEPEPQKKEDWGVSGSGWRH